MKEEDLNELIDWTFEFIGIIDSTRDYYIFISEKYQEKYKGLWRQKRQ